eukprot:9498862-Pyramimonas_sp.AAC.2
MLANFFDKTSRHDINRHDCAQALNRFYHELNNWNHERSHVEVGVAARQHLSMYRLLHIEARIDNSDSCFWKLFPKHHLFIHCAEDQIEAHGNPASHWCYGDEDEIGGATEAARFARPRTIGTSILDRYRCGDLFKFQPASSA